MAYIQGDSRTQGTLFPERLDELIAADSAVRVIDAFVDTLDVAELGFQKAQPAVTGRPPYDPADLLKLYIYGYLNQIRSSRRLEREAARNVELLWLLNRLQPDFKTIADFRKDNPAPIMRVCRAFTLFCRGQNLFSRELVAIDGSKFQAVASRGRHFSAKSLRKEQARVDQRIQAYLAELSRSDATEPAEPAQADVQAALVALQVRREQLQALAQQLQDSGEKQSVQGEPEARLMRGAHGYQVGYNVQTAVDEKHKLIAEFEVVSAGDDRGQLFPMARLAQQQLQSQKLTAVVDGGYLSSEQALLCEQAGIAAVIPMQQVVNTKGKQYFSKERFAYDADSDTFCCPAGERLERRYQISPQLYQYTTNACLRCALRPQCTRNPYRRVNRHLHAAALEVAAQRAREHPHLLRLRAALAEHPFAGLKYLMGTPRFVVRGLKKVKAEMALTVLGYNLKRVTNILGARTLIERLAV